MSQLELSNTQHFPSLSELPNDEVANFSFYHQSPPGGIVLLPSRHWVFLCEITENITFTRPHYFVKDRSGIKTQVAFYLEGKHEVQFELIRSSFVVGHTLAVFYADSHYFADGSFGLRVEDVSTVKMIPCSLNSLLTADPTAVVTRKTCSSCARDSDAQLLSCSRCKTRYCSQECQRADWPRHKQTCSAIQQVRAWRKRDWKRWDKYWNAF